MKRNLLTLVFLIFNTVYVVAQDSVDLLLETLDHKIKNNEVYIDLKERKLEELKARKSHLKSEQVEFYALNQALFKEYKNYISDSAIHYLDLNMDIAYDLNDPKKIGETHIASATLFVRLGMYKEASDLLEGVKKSVLDHQLQLDYFLAYRELFLGLGLYSQNSRDRNRYWHHAKRYNDTVKTMTSEMSEEYLRILEKSFRLTGDYNKALEVNNQRLKLTKPNTASYALVTFHRSLIYRKMEDVENEKKYLALSAISDIQLAIKDNASISILADILMREGDVNRAYHYIRFSLDNIRDYNNRIRSSEALNIQTIIDKEYQNRNEKKNRELQSLLAVACVLSLLLAISVVYVYKQMRKGQVFSRRLKEINEELELLNGKLHHMNNELKKRNLEVAEANHIKEEYIAYFLDECSKYIAKLDDYRKMVNKKLHEKQYENLYKITRNTSLKEEESKELFVNFDTMFVNLFPDFLTEFNALLVDEEQVVLKKDEVLNTELRIYALIRLGIGDSSKIANFLGYSVNTIYNYRTKMKNKAKISREDFEWRVKKIDAFM